MQKLRTLFLAVSSDLWDSLETKNVPSTHAQHFWKVWVGCRKNHWNMVTVCSVHITVESENLQQTLSQAHKITCKEIVEVLFQCF